MGAKQILFLYFALIFIVLIRVVFFFSIPDDLTGGQKLKFTTEVYIEPKISGNYKFINTTYGNFIHSAPITLKIPSNSTINFGDKIEVEGTVKKINFANRQQTQLELTKIKSVKPTELSILGNIRNHIVNVTERSFSNEYSGLLLGIMLGIKNNLSQRQIQAMQSTGFSHFMVIDGMKITLFSGFILTFISFFLKRNFAVLLSIFIVLIYVALSGFEVSALRAGIMAVFALSAQILGRQNSGFHILILTAGLMLIWNPLLLQSVAFQLSFAATAGIITLKPLFKLNGIFMEDLSMTLAAQIASLPILLTTFGNYGLMSIPAHILVLWEIPIIMVINGFGALVSFILEPLGSIIMQASTPLLWYFQNVNYFFANFDFNIQTQNFPIAFSISYYLLLISAVFFINKKRG